MREIIFTAKSCDARYGYEGLYLKEVEGTGFKIVAGDAFLYVDYEWIEVDIDSVQIFDSKQ